MVAILSRPQCVNTASDDTVLCIEDITWTNADW